jgi:hypothetical protein
MNGSALRLVISQPEAALDIQPPIFETTVAVQTTAKTVCRNGLKGEGAVCGPAADGFELVLMHYLPIRLLSMGQSNNFKSFLLGQFRTKWAKQRDALSNGIGRLGQWS